MVPTVCVTEFPMAGATVTSRTRRRRRRSQNGTKWRRYTSEEMLRNGIETPSENCSRRLCYADKAPDCPVAYESGEYPTNANEDYRRLVAERKKDLLNIVVRTIILVHRNRILHKRLNALWVETRRMLRSASNNPENQQQGSQVSSHSEDSSSTEKVVSALSPVHDTDPTRDSFCGIASTRDNREAHQ